MKKITKIAGAVGTKLRDRSRSVKFRLRSIGRVARAKGSIDQDKLKRRYGQLLDATSRVVGQAKRFSTEIAQGVKRARSVLEQLALDASAARTRCDGIARPAADETDQGTHLSRQHAQ
jgi:IS5 family transposase